MFKPGVLHGRPFCGIGDSRFPLTLHHKVYDHRAAFLFNQTIRVIPNLACSIRPNYWNALIACPDCGSNSTFWPIKITLYFVAQSERLARGKMQKFHFAGMLS